ncbi:MAG: DUF2804 domain-containing protein [Polyangiales bacterium]
MTHEHELTTPVTLGTLDGRRARVALGWSRRPLHRCELPGRRLRRKRWDYWCVSTDRHFFAAFVADLDYLRVAVVTLLDVETGQLFERVAPRLGSVEMPSTVGGGAIHFEAPQLQLCFDPSGHATRLRVAAQTLTQSIEVDLAIAVPAESLNVVVPWDDRHYQFTSKQIGLDVEGSMVWNGRPVPIDGAFAALDFGRGVWPHDTRWNWAAAAGRADRRRIAFNLGGQWTDGTGSTENGLFVDGRLHKIGSDVTFERGPRRWKLRDAEGEVDLEFTPARERRLGVPMGALTPLGAQLHWCIGTFEGRILDQRVTALRGWAEDLAARW